MCPENLYFLTEEHMSILLPWFSCALDVFWFVPLFNRNSNFALYITVKFRTTCWKDHGVRRKIGVVSGLIFELDIRRPHCSDFQEQISAPAPLFASADGLLAIGGHR